MYLFDPIKDLDSYLVISLKEFRRIAVGHFARASIYLISFLKRNYERTDEITFDLFIVYNVFFFYIRLIFFVVYFLIYYF